MTASITAQWTRVVSSERLQRSSHCFSVLGSNAFVFGGEVKPREPVDNQIDIVSLGPHSSTTETYPAPSVAPSPRVGSASATLGKSFYLFSGRGGVAMAPVEEKGALWKYTAESNSGSWSLIEPADASAPYPAARSYHTATSDGDSTLYFHAGCPESGRLGDLWSFNVQTRTWKELAPAPDPPRGGTSIAFAHAKLYRMNGFDGTHEVGGAIDIYDSASNVWSAVNFTADNVSGPGPRSVSALVPVTWNGEALLLTMFGEQDPSSLGHAGAGKMRDDVWGWNIQGQTWLRVDTSGSAQPAGRGWFDVDVLSKDGDDVVVVHGGLAEGNTRHGDVWLLCIS